MQGMHIACPPIASPSSKSHETLLKLADYRLVITLIINNIMGTTLELIRRINREHAQKYRKFVRFHLGHALIRNMNQAILYRDWGFMCGGGLMALMFAAFTNLDESRHWSVFIAAILPGIGGFYCLSMALYGVLWIWVQNQRR